MIHYISGIGGIMDKLLKKVAVITGSTRGLGLAFARAFAKEGASVVITSRQQQDVDEAVKLLKSEGANAAGITADVGDLAQMERLAKVAVETFGKLDIWINNAGSAGPYGPTLGFTPEAFKRVVDTNILGTYYGSRTAMKYFLNQKSGKLINLLGAGTKGPIAYQNAYASSKAWIKWFTMGLAKETKKSGVGVYAFNPGLVNTEFLTNIEVIQGYEKRLDIFPTIIRLIGKQPEEPAQKMVWIASSATDGKTGLEVNYGSSIKMALAFAGEGLRKLTGRKVETVKINMKVIPPAM
jgi:NAD(P)-dependent dehydrogenase (short-subunit alcohol dehydrogenase family)